jgi:hypothetical protein
MSDIAAAALLRGAGKAGRRFMAEVAVSAMATLCITLVFSLWPRPESSNGPASPPATAASSPSALDAAPVPSAIALETQASTGASGVRSASVRNAMTGAASLVEPLPIVSAAPVRARPQHQKRITARGALPSCRSSCTDRSTTAAVNIRPPEQRAAIDTHPVSLATTVEPDRSPSVFGVPVPSIAMPEIVTRSVRPVLQGASAVTDMASGLAKKW